MNGKKSVLSKSICNERDFILLALSGVFLIGELFGVIIFCKSNTGIISAQGFIGNFFFNRLESTFLQTVIDSFSGNFILVILCAVLGSGAFFQPIEIIIPAFKGVGVGILLAEVYYSSGLKGIICSILLIVPYSAVSALIVSVAAREAVYMSNTVAQCIFKGNNYDKIDFDLYLTKYVILLALLAAAALADSLITYLSADIWTGLLEI